MWAIVCRVVGRDTWERTDADPFEAYDDAASAAEELELVDDDGNEVEYRVVEVDDDE